MGYKLDHENQIADKVRITTNPRWKESGLSGCEWRFSASVDFYRKGKLIYSRSFRDVETALQMAYTDFVIARESGKCDPNQWQKTKCFQEGCSNNATIKATLKNEYCCGGKCGQKIDTSWRGDEKSYRLFCSKHEMRGDQSIEDCDSNYVKEDIVRRTSL